MKQPLAAPDITGAPAALRAKMYPGTLRTLAPALFANDDNRRRCLAGRRASLWRG